MELGTKPRGSFYNFERQTIQANYSNPAANIKLSADASSYGVGALLLQKTNNEWQPVAYASCTMTDTERRYAQIEKKHFHLLGRLRNF